IELDDMGLQGSSAFLLGSVLEQVLARQASLNSFTETRVRTTSRGAIMQWPARVGQVAIL
ncbi:MAG TPA: type VI secretion system baseplate subunit TssF, partial [Aquabacterium sp.]|nr:type VI secretion system baseplate subunit TssF [Aquabacterium sp.]